jgi:hypothetical protein
MLHAPVDTSEPCKDKFQIQTIIVDPPQTLDSEQIVEFVRRGSCTDTGNRVVLLIVFFPKYALNHCFETHVTVEERTQGEDY